jgi:hypothetical protein
MTKNKQIIVRGKKREKVDADKIALAYVLLAQAILAAKDVPEFDEATPIVADHVDD